MTEDSDNTGNEEKIKDVKVVCPICKEKKIIKLPEKVINQSKQLTTVSIPANLTCEHSYQVFVDKNFTPRGYQKVDFVFSKMEILEKEEEDSPKIPHFQEIVSLLRNSVDDQEVLGSAILTIDGKVLYSSLPQNTLFSTMKEFEVRNKKKLVPVKRMFLELETETKVCSNYMELDNTKFILVLVFSEKIKLGMGNLILRQLAKKIETVI
jgi:predicted regulator of Ras-like GTPase activity (Roadblock/LC7/MglB family)